MTLSKAEAAALLLARRERCKSDLLYLGGEILGYDVMLERSDVQQAMAEQAMHIGDTLTLCPRSWTKSTVITVVGSIWYVLNHPDDCVLIVSNTITNAQKFLSEIVSHFYLNDHFRRLFPEFCPKRASQKGTTWEYRLPCQRPGRKEATFEVAGMDMTVTGRHYERIVEDDVVHKENVCPTVTPETMAKTYDYIQTVPALLNGLCPHKHITCVGTRWHDGDAWGKMLQNRGEDDLKLLVIKPYDEDGESNWPERFSVAQLEQTRAQMGAYNWACLMEQDPLPPDVAARFLDDWIHSAALDENEEVIPPANGILAITVDPALSKDWRADRTAIGLTSVPPEGGLYLLDKVIGRWTPHGISEKIIDLYEKWVLKKLPPEWIGIETDVGGLAIFHVLQQILTERGVYIPLRRLHSQLRSKEVRIGKLQAYVEAHGLFLGPRMADVRQEILRYPVGEHDDILDMLALRADNLQQPDAPRAKASLGPDGETGADVLNLFGVGRRKASLFRVR